MVIIKDGFYRFTKDGKQYALPYNSVNSPECTYQGMVGKHTPYGFILKPGSTGKVDKNVESLTRDVLKIDMDVPSPDPIKVDDYTAFSEESDDTDEEINTIDEIPKRKKKW